MPFMRVRIHRGANEIGGSCVEIEAGGSTVVIDAGLPLTSRSDVPPKPPEIDAQMLRAIVISHPHLDHYGLLPWMPQVPVAMGAAARRILRAAQPYMKQPDFKLDGPDLADRQPITIGPFRITPYLVDHSAYDAYALLIEAGGKRLFYSGDIRIHGRKHRQVERLISDPPNNIDALLLEGTTLGRITDGPIPQTEVEIEKLFTERFPEAKGLTLVQVSAQNIDRLVSTYRACQKTGRTLLIDLYTAEVLAATENQHVPQSHWDGIRLCIPQRQRIQIKRNQWFDALAKHSSHRVFLNKHVSRNPERYVLLFRGLWLRDLEQAGLLKGACLIHSQWEGYLKEDRCIGDDTWRQSHGIEFHQIHTSGHASPADLRRLATALASKILVPIHSMVPERFTSIHPNVIRYADGEWWDV